LYVGFQVLTEHFQTALVLADVVDTGFIVGLWINPAVTGLEVFHDLATPFVALDDSL